MLVQLTYIGYESEYILGIDHPQNSPEYRKSHLPNSKFSVKNCYKKIKGFLDGCLEDLESMSH